MKTEKITTILKVFLFILLFALASPSFVHAQPGPPSQGNNGNQEPQGGGAPIGGGVFILMGLAAVYGGWKLRQEEEKTV